MVFNDSIKKLVDAHVQTAIAVWSVPPRCYGEPELIVSTPPTVGTGVEIVCPEWIFQDLGLIGSSGLAHTTEGEWDGQCHALLGMGLSLRLSREGIVVGMKESFSHSFFIQDNPSWGEEVGRRLYRKALKFDYDALIGWWGNTVISEGEFLTSPGYINLLYQLISTDIHGTRDQVQENMEVLLSKDFEDPPTTVDILSMIIPLAVYKRITDGLRLTEMVDKLRTAIYLTHAPSSTRNRYKHQHYTAFLMAYATVLGRDWWYTQVKHDSIFYTSLRSVM